MVDNLSKKNYFFLFFKDCVTRDMICCKIVWGWASRFWPELWTITQEGEPEVCTSSQCTIARCTFSFCAICVIYCVFFFFYEVTKHTFCTLLYFMSFCAFELHFFTVHFITFLHSSLLDILQVTKLQDLLCTQPRDFRGIISCKMMPSILLEGL